MFVLENEMLIERLNNKTLFSLQKRKTEEKTIMKSAITYLISFIL